MTYKKVFQLYNYRSYLYIRQSHGLCTPWHVQFSWQFMYRSVRRVRESSTKVSQASSDRLVRVGTEVGRCRWVCEVLLFESRERYTCGHLWSLWCSRQRRATPINYGAFLEKNKIDFATFFDWPGFSKSNNILLVLSFNLDLIQRKRRKNTKAYHEMWKVLVWVGLDPLFNDISTTVGYLVLKPSWKKIYDSCWSITSGFGGIKGFIPFPRLLVRLWTV